MLASQYWRDLKKGFCFSQEVAIHELKSPTLVIIGEVVALAPGWHLARATSQSLQDGRSYDPLLMSSLVKETQQFAVMQ